MVTALAVLGSTAVLAQVSNLIWLGVVFFIIALVAYALGARGVAGMSAGIGRTLLIVGVVLALIFILWGMFAGRPAV